MVIILHFLIFNLIYQPTHFIVVSQRKYESDEKKETIICI